MLPDNTTISIKCFVNTTLQTRDNEEVILLPEYTQCQSPSFDTPFTNVEGSAGLAVEVSVLLEG